LISGTQKVLLSAPVLYELALHAADLDVGTQLYLVKADVAETPTSILDGQNTRLDGEHRSLFVDVPAGDYILRALSSGFKQMRVTVPCGEVEFVGEVTNAFAINEVKPGKLGQRVGLRVGDLIVALNGEAVNGNNFHSKIAVAVESAAVELTVERGGATVTISLGPIEAGSQAMEQIGVMWFPRTR
jgi:C-terminal processing protease CtpA/Prc